jgi:quinol monooxygenase YgiN
MLEPGYVSGETLQADDDPTHWIVISTWTDKDQWVTWQATPERQKLTDDIQQLLVSPEKVTILHWAGKQMVDVEDEGMPV